MRRAPLLLLAVLALACGDDAPPDGSIDGGVADAEVLDGAALDGEVDAGRLDGGEDAGAPDAGAPSCSALLAPRAPFAIAPGFRGTQIHPAAVFDGERLWVTFTAVEEGEGEGRGFDVFVLSLDCAGETSAPVQVNAAVEPNDIDGTVAVHGERVLVAWQADEGTGTIGTVVRAFDRSLAPLGGDRPLTTTRLGEPVLGTTWMPELHPRGEEGFFLVGSRGVEALSTFQVFLQALDAEGEASGETVEPASVEGAAQSTPTMLALGDELHLAWVQEPEMGNAQGVYLAPGADAPAPIAPMAVGSGAPSLGAVDGDVVAAIDVGASRREVRLVALGAGEEARVDRDGKAPWLATGEGGGAVLYLRGGTGFFAESLHARPFDWDGESFAVGSEVDVPVGNSVPIPYRPALVHVEGDVYFAIWSEGTSPDFEVRAAFLAL